MSDTYDPVRIAELCVDMRHAISDVGKVRDRYVTVLASELGELADQLAAAVAEVKRLYTLAIEQGERAYLVEQDRDEWRRRAIDLGYGGKPW